MAEQASAATQMGKRQYPNRHKAWKKTISPPRRVTVQVMMTAPTAVSAKTIAKTVEACGEPHESVKERRRMKTKGPHRSQFLNDCSFALNFQFMGIRTVLRFLLVHEMAFRQVERLQNRHAHLPIVITSLQRVFHMVSSSVDSSGGGMKVWEVG